MTSENKPADPFSPNGRTFHIHLSVRGAILDFTKRQQVHMCGNSVSPPPMAALARANDPWRAEERQARAA